MPDYLSADEYKRFFPGISRSCLDKTLALGALAASKREPSPKPALDKKQRPRKKGSSRLALVCSIIACRHRLLDDDNGIAGAKPLRDAIARMLGIDDADPRIRWEYGQLRTDGEQGTIVKLEWR
jgi:hypothetical protein